MQVAATSEIRHVQVFARGALVTRRVTAPDLPDDGDVTVLVGGITALADPGSFRAQLPDETSATRAVVMLRSAMVVPPAGALVGTTVEAVRSLQARRARLSLEREQVQRGIERLRAAVLDPGFRPRGAPDGDRAVTARMAETLAAEGALDDVSRSLAERLVDLDDALLANERDLVRARLDDAQSRSAARQGEGHPSRELRVQLTGRGALPWIDVTYAVPAARWWPVYTLRITDRGSRALWWLEALVAQCAGEDWSRVALSLSTADLLFDARLPELASLRLGRAQPAPHRGYRAPPEGLDRLFAGYDKSLAPPAEPPSPRQAPKDAEPAALLDDALELEAEVNLDEGTMTMTRAGRVQSMDLRARAAPAPARLAAMPQSVPMPAARKSMGLLSGLAEAAASVGDALAPSSGGGGPSRDEPEALPLEPADAWMDFDALSLGPYDRRDIRGRLRRDEDAARAEQVTAARTRLDGLSLPTGLQDPRGSRGMFDHRYDAEARADIPSDGQLHRVSLGTGESAPTLRWRTVPRESPEVFREAELRNPFDAPLLAGPVDVYVDGSLLAVASIERIDRGGVMRVGMGTEERLRVARNVRMREETAGVFGGDSVLHHHVTIELSSTLATPALVEVIDRVPVSDDKSVKVEGVSSRPDAEPYDQTERGASVRGGMRWRPVVPAGGKLSIDLEYRVVIPSKNEIVGGNRRD